ncbi:MAG: serine/threonine-protein kinase, partial [Ilumatobacter sp.]
DVGVKIAGALQAAHDGGVVHRDITPHNVFVSDFGEPALGDFGISSIDDERALSEATAISVAYCAPEVLDGEEATFLSDVYSLAATLFHMLTGRTPFEASEIGEVIRQVLDASVVPSIDRADVPKELSALLVSAMSLDPDRRPDSAGAFGAALQEIQMQLGSAPTSVPLRRDERYDATRTAGLAAPGAPSRFGSGGAEARRPGDRLNGSADDVAGRSGRVRRREGIAIDVVIVAVVVVLVGFAAVRLLWPGRVVEEVDLRALEPASVSSRGARDERCRRRPRARRAAIADLSRADRTNRGARRRRRCCT